MRIQTFSVVIGTRACNADCPFCVSKMTGFGELPQQRRLNERNLDKAARLAQLGDCTTVLLTGKGEPTLYPSEITRYVELLSPRFPLIELQTNALAIGRLKRDGHSGVKNLDADTLKHWHTLGLDTIAVSIVSEKSAENAAIYHEDYPELDETIGYLHGHGYSVRLCVMMQKGGIDSPARLEELLTYCRRLGVEQLTVRPIRKPAAPSQDQTASSWVARHGVDEQELESVRAWVDVRGTRLLTLMHGARVYDIGGQNLCLADCLTVEAADDAIRTLIFYADGRLAYDWQYDGAVLLGGRLED